MSDRPRKPEASGLVLLTLAAGQFLMTLDTSVMNVSIAQAAADLGTTVTGIRQNPQVPQEVKDRAGVELAGGIPFISTSDLEQAMEDAGASAQLTKAVLDANAAARIAGLDTALALLGVIAIAALFFTRKIPNVQAGDAGPPSRQEEAAPAQQLASAWACLAATRRAP